MAGELVTAPGLIQYGDLLMGRSQAAGITTIYRWRALTGWEDTPGLDSGTVLRAADHGAWPGRLLAQTRTITVDLLVRTGAGGMGAAVRTLASALPIDSDEERALVIQLDDRGPLLVWARCTRRSLPVSGAAWTLGVVAGAAVQWEASDSRRYDLAEQLAVTALPAPEAGLSWGSPETGLAWGSPETGLAWGTPGSTGDITAVNAGDAPAHPVLELRGPVVTPSVTLLGSGLVLEYDITLAAADVLVVDTQAGTAQLSGQDRLYTATLRSSPEEGFVLPRGVSTLSFRAAPGSTDPAASATVRWRSAYW